MGSVPIGLRWLNFHSPGLPLSLAIGYPGNGCDLGLCDLRPCAAHTHSSWGHKTLVTVGSEQHVPAPITGREAGLRAMVLSVLWEKLAWLLACSPVRWQACKLVERGIRVWLIFVIHACPLGNRAPWWTQVYNVLPMIPKSQSSTNGKMFLNSFGNKIWPQLT